MTAAPVPAEPSAPESAGPLILLVTVPLPAGSVVEDIRAAAPPGTPVRVVAPALSSAVRFWTNDSSARHEAAARLAATIGVLDGAGIDASGEIGDDDPLQAVEDAVAVHRGSAVVVITGTADRQGWLEVGLARAARGRLPVPVRHVVVDGEAVLAGHEDGEAPRRLHPRRDLWLTVILGVLATFGSGATFVALERAPGAWAIVWATVFDVVPKALFVWALWRLYLKRR